MGWGGGLVPEGGREERQKVSKRKFECGEEVECCKDNRRTERGRKGRREEGVTNSQDREAVAGLAQ